MLFNIDPNCSPETSYCLAQMGHGDELVIADRNFPPHQPPCRPAFQKVIPMPGFSALHSCQDNQQVCCRLIRVGSSDGGHAAP